MNYLLGLKLPEISTESERNILSMGLKENKAFNKFTIAQESLYSLSSESLKRFQLKVESLPSDASYDDFILALEDLDGEDKNVFARIGKKFKNVWEDIKSINENFERWNQKGMREIDSVVQQLDESAGYADPGMISRSNILTNLGCFNRLGVSRKYDADGFLSYLDWGVAQLQDAHASDTIRDFIISVLYLKDDFNTKGATTKYLDKIQDKEMRSWLSKGTLCGCVARIAGPNTYIVSIKDASFFETLTSQNGLLFSSHVLRIDNYSCDAPGGFKSLSPADIKKLKSGLKARTGTCNKIIETFKKNNIAAFSFGNLLRLIVKYYLAQGNLVGLMSYIRTYDKLVFDFINSYIKYINTMVEICKLHEK